MTTLRNLSLVPFLFLLLVGCATKGPTFTELAPSIDPPSDNAGRIYFYRTTILGAALQPEIMINDSGVGKSIAQGFFYIDKEPGKYEIKTTTEVDRTLSLLLEEGETRYVKFNVSMGFLLGHVYPELVSNEEGEKEIKNCKYTGETY